MNALHRPTDRPEISIVVAAYNAESTLRRLVDGVLAQTFTQYELILVDDGSTDRSGNIADAYAASDPRIRVIHKRNGGVSSARQAGVYAARGRYTIHLDADDWVEPPMLEALYQRAVEAKADMVTCDYLLELPHKTKRIRQAPDSLTTNALLHQYLRGALHSALWNKLIKTSCYEGIRFPEGMNCCEDMVVLAAMLQAGRIVRVVYLDQAFYHYDNTREGNLTGRVTSTTLRGQMFLADHFAQTLDHEAFRRELTALRVGAKRVALILGNFTQKQFNALYPDVDQEIHVVWRPMGFIPSLSLYLATKGWYKVGSRLTNGWSRFVRWTVSLRKKK